jgi:peptidoglycan hydrolase-like protein with peptidoglycan-binding domain
MEIVPILWLMSPPQPVLWRLVAVLAGLVVTVSLLPATSYAASGWSLRDRFAREATYALDRDVDPWHIEHVRELQLRLRFLGLFERRISGVDGVATQRAVREFQAAHGLPESNTATHATWAALIEATIRGRSFIPRGCHAAGRHACYAVAGISSRSSTTACSTTPGWSVAARGTPRRASAGSWCSGETRTT